MIKPITEFTKNYINSNILRFHTPGHKGNINIFKPNAELFDITEITGADSLYNSQGIIMETESIASSVFGSHFSILSASGSTLCIQTMLSLVAKDGGKIIAARNSHISFINTVSLLGLDPIWIYPEYIDKSKISGIINPTEVEKLIKQNPDAVALYITSPDYLGVMQDISSISKITKKYNIPLIVDNAHGSHLKFTTPDLHPNSLGADMCCDSLHKTLPAITGAAVLHINNPKFKKEDVKKKMSYFGSTSPSYLILVSIENTLEYISSPDCQQHFDKLSKTVDNLRKTSQKIGFKNIEHLVSPAHFVLDFGSIGYTAKETYKIFYDNKIEPEMISNTHVVFLISTLNTDYEIKKLQESMLLFKKRNKVGPESLNVTPPIKKLSPRQTMFSESESVKIEDSLNRIVAETTVSYPPGIPIIMPGEQVNQSVISYLKSNGINRIKVVKY